MIALIENVLYVPGMSVGQLVEKGFSITIKDDLLKINDLN